MLSSVLAFQLLLVGTGATCVMLDSTAPNSARAMPTAGGMSGMEQAAAPSGGGARAPAQQRGDMPCERPMSPAACQAMAPCALAFVETGTARDDPMTVVPSGVRVLSVLAPLSRTTAPELPPPRA